MNPDSKTHHPTYTILIVDDSPANLGVLVNMLEEEFNYRVIISRDGESGLKRAKYVRPDLILLDVKMPGMDGFEACRRLKMNETTREIPIIFTTVLADTADKVKGFEAGGVDYVTKPVQVEEVLARIQTHLEIRNLQTQLEAQNRRLQQEITKRERSEEALRNSQKKYSMLFNEMLDGFALHEMIFDEHGKPVDYRFLDVNPAFENLTDLRRDNIIGKTVLEVLPGLESYWIELYGNVVLTGEPVHFENSSKELEKYYAVTAFRPKKDNLHVFLRTSRNVSRPRKNYNKPKRLPRKPNKRQNPPIAPRANF